MRNQREKPGVKKITRVKIFQPKKNRGQKPWTLSGRFQNKDGQRKPTGYGDRQRNLINLSASNQMNNLAG